MSHNSVLLVVDVQNGFTPGGNLAVAKADQIIPKINQIAQQFQHVVLTQDWHPDQHISFVENHVAKAAYEVIELAYGSQVLWPKHCVQGTHDAEFHPYLDIQHAELIIRKGFNAAIDSYSAFQEADRTTKTGLAGYLKERGIQRVFVVGIATDFCVAWSAIDSAELGFQTYVIEDACQGIDLNGSLAQAWQYMQQAGVVRIQTADVTADLITGVNA
jgi:nicotinamidase/pyrazinamidase